MGFTVDLSFGYSFGLVIPHASGVTFTNQAAGVLCSHPKVEGLFIPLDEGIGKPALWAFGQHFRGQWNSLSAKDADVIDGALRKAELGYIRTDRYKLNDSVEAWVHVLVDLKTAAPFIEGSEVIEAVLTWPNSD